MTDLEKRAEEYLKNYFCKRIDEEYMIEECNSGERSRYVSFEERKGMLIEFAQQETELLSKHILELQQTNGALTDRVNELNKLFANCDTCRRTCDIGNCCRFGSEYLPDTEKVLNKKNQLTEVKKILRMVIDSYNHKERFSFEKDLAKAEAFLKE